MVDGAGRIEARIRPARLKYSQTISSTSGTTSGSRTLPRLNRLGFTAGTVAHTATGILTLIASMISPPLLHLDRFEIAGIHQVTDGNVLADHVVFPEKAR